MGCNCKNDKNKKTGEQKNTEKKSSVFNKVLLIIVKLFSIQILDKIRFLFMYALNASP